MLLQGNVCRGGKAYLLTRTRRGEWAHWYGFFYFILFSFFQLINAFFKFEKVVPKFVKYRVSNVE